MHIEKTWHQDTGTPHKIVFLLFQLFPACCYVAKICWSSCGGPFFVGAPVRPNMLNMPKSASACTGQVADCTTRGCYRRLCVLSFRSFGGICETAICPVRELVYPRVVDNVQLPYQQQASIVTKRRIIRHVLHTSFTHNIIGNYHRITCSRSRKKLISELTCNVTNISWIFRWRKIRSIGGNSVVFTSPPTHQRRDRSQCCRSLQPSLQRRRHEY